MNFTELYVVMWKGLKQLGRKQFWLFVNIILNIIQVLIPGKILMN
jgi:hypothetical protein